MRGPTPWGSARPAPRGKGQRGAGDGTHVAALWMLIGRSIALGHLTEKLLRSDAGLALLQRHLSLPHPPPLDRWDSSQS